MSGQRLEFLYHRWPGNTLCGRISLSFNSVYMLNCRTRRGHPVPCESLRSLRPCLQSLYCNDKNNLLTSLYIKPWEQRVKKKKKIILWTKEALQNNFQWWKIEWNILTYQTGGTKEIINRCTLILAETATSLTSSPPLEYIQSQNTLATL